MNPSVDTSRSTYPANPPTQHQQPGVTYNGTRLNFAMEYIKSVPSILKIIEMVCCLLAFACSLGGRWSHLGGGWVEFVSFVSLVVTAIWFLLHIFSYVPSFLTLCPTELVTYLAMAVCFLIAFIISAARAAQLRGGPVGATAFFTFVAMVVYGIECFFLFRSWQTDSLPRSTATPAGISTPPPSYPTGSTAAGGPTGFSSVDVKTQY